VLKLAGSDEGSVIQDRAALRKFLYSLIISFLVRTILVAVSTVDTITSFIILLSRYITIT
jgi:hypothetical protein